MKTKIKLISLILGATAIMTLVMLIVTNVEKRIDGLENFEAAKPADEIVHAPAPNEDTACVHTKDVGSSDNNAEIQEDIPPMSTVMAELLFPLTEITLGMSIDDPIIENVVKDVRWHKENWPSFLNNEINLSVKTSGSKYWAGSTVNFKDEKVVGLVLGRQYPPPGNSLPTHRPDGWKPEDEVKVEPVKADISVVKDSVKTVFELLRQELGTSYEKSVLSDHPSLTAMYVWRREDDIVYFRHSSFERYEEKGFYSYSLNIVPLDAKLPEPHPYKSDNEVHGPKLWLDAAED